MLQRIVVPAVLLLTIISAAHSASGENWPGWRGPRGDGTSNEQNTPRSWSGATGENIAWKAAVPGAGHSSPIVWGERIFLTSCLADAQQRVLVCLDARSGQTIWRRVVLESPLETKHNLNSYASGTPATDGERVYVTFLEVDGNTQPARNASNTRPVTPGRVVVAAYDFAGRQQWLVKPGEFFSVHGFCSSPVLFADLVIVNGDHDGDSYIAALSKSTGEIVWKIPRANQIRSYVTPIVRDIGGRTQLVFSGSKGIVSLDPRDGSQHWRIDGPTEQFVASMVYDGKMFYMAAGFPTHHVLGIRPDGAGNVTDTHVAWHSTSVACYVPSPVVVGDYLLVADDRGTANCFQAASGERLWQERLGKHYSASLVVSGGLAYFLADDGVTKIVEPGPELKVVAENPLGENCYASPAISGGRLYIRGEQHLYCIGGAAQTGG